MERLDWKEIDFESGVIEVTAEESKKCAAQVCEDAAELARVVDAAAQARGQGHASEMVLQEWFEQAREAAEISDWPDNALRHASPAITWHTSKTRRSRA